MKTKVIFLALIAITILSSCKKDSESLNSSETILLGTWELTAMTYTGTNASTSQGFTTVTDFSGVTKDMTYEIEFSENPKTYETSGGYTVELTSTIEDVLIDGEVVVPGYTFVNDVPIEGAAQTGSWSSDGNTIEGLVFDNGQGMDANSSYEIEELSDSSLRITFNSNMVLEPSPGVTSDVELQGEMVLEKL